MPLWHKDCFYLKAVELSSEDTSNCRAAALKARSCGAGRNLGELVCRILAWCAWPPGPGSSMAPHPLGDIPRHRGQCIWVRRWSEPLSGPGTVTNRKGESLPHRGIAANSPSPCWPLHQLLWSAEVSGHLSPGSSPPRLWLAFWFPWRLLPAEYSPWAGRTVGWHRDEDKFCGGGFIIWAFDRSQTLC